MARKLKTYITSIGFFEEAIAAPSMKAALEAWGSEQNLFHQGFAKETTDPDIVAATLEHPGVVLKRAVGSTGAFKIHAKLPDIHFADEKPSKTPRKIISKPTEKHPPKSARDVQNQQRKAAEAYERERQRAEKQLQKEKTARKKIAEKRRAAIAKAEFALRQAQKRHGQDKKKLTDQLAKINKQLMDEEAFWNILKKRLEAAVEKAKG